MATPVSGALSLAVRMQKELRGLGENNKRAGILQHMLEVKVCTRDRHVCCKYVYWTKRAVYELTWGRWVS